MKHRLLVPCVVAVVLAMGACGGGDPADPDTPSAPQADSDDQTSERPSGAEATVTIGDHVYEFSSDPALTWGKVMRAPCMEILSSLQISLWLVAVDGEAAEELDGTLELYVSDADSQSSESRVDINVGPEGVEYVAGAALNIVDVEDQPITLTRDGYTISGTQDVYNRTYDAPEPRVVTAEIDASCVDF